jgi:hypothetical protein
VWIALSVVLLFQGQGAIPPPAALTCLQRHYGIEPIEQDGVWSARLPDGRVLPFDNGAGKTFDEMLNHPDLHDMFAVPYPRGPLQHQLPENHDPGRVRVQALFATVYAGGAAVMRPLSFLGQRVRVHPRAAAAFARIDARLRELVRTRPALKSELWPLGGAFFVRPIAGTQRLSAHSWGIAIDVNPKGSDYWRWQRGPNRGWKRGPSQAVVDAFEAEGFIWGGRWYHFDTMHFEYRPELLDESCFAKRD